MDRKQPNNQAQAPQGQGKPEAGSAPQKRLSYYGLQLFEKQKAKKMYGMRERQFRRFFGLASKEKGDKGAKLVELLERRLDNVIFRSGWAATRTMARQMVVHRHVKVNGQVVDAPSYIVVEADEVTFRNDKMPKVVKNMEFTKNKIEVPKWLDKTADGVKVKALPVRTDIDVPIRENLIVELYSK